MKTEIGKRNVCTYIDLVARKEKAGQAQLDGVGQLLLRVVFVDFKDLDRQVGFSELCGDFFCDFDGLSIVDSEVLLVGDLPGTVV
jgi:hypothetical protein